MRALLKEQLQQQDDMLKYLELLHLRDVNFNESYYIYDKSRNTNIAYNYENMCKMLRHYKNDSDIYVSVNAFKTSHYKASSAVIERDMKRSKINVTVLKNIFIDLDLKDTKYSISDAHIEILQLVQQGVIPRPSMIVCSGRGLHLYWNIGSYKATEALKSYYIKITKSIADRLVHMGVDKSKLEDYSSVLRVPCTVNSRSKSLCYIVESNNLVYSLNDLKETYFKNDFRFKPKLKVIQTKLDIKEIAPVIVKDPKTETKFEVVKSIKTLTDKRLNDLQKLLQLRNYDMTNCRTNYMFISCVIKQFHENLEYHELLDYAEKINNSFTIRKQHRKVENLVDSVFKYYDSSKKLNYTHVKIIELLQITEEEQRQLSVIINKAEKKRRDAENERNKRRNSDGLTKKEQQKKNTRESVQELKSKGLTQIQVAKKLDKSIATIKTYWNI